MSLSRRLPSHSLSWSLRTRITLLAMTLLLLDRCQTVWQRLISRKPPTINSLQDLPTDYTRDPDYDFTDDELDLWMSYLDDPIVQINCASHLDRCLESPSASKNLNSSRSKP